MEQWEKAEVGEEMKGPEGGEQKIDPRGQGLHFAPHHLPSAWSRLWDVIGTQFFFLLVYRSFLNLKMSIIRVSNRMKSSPKDLYKKNAFWLYVYGGNVGERGREF